jgi:hypothetical protein
MKLHQDNANRINSLFKYLGGLKKNKKVLYSIIALFLLIIIWPSDTSQSRRVAENMIDAWMVDESYKEYCNEEFFVTSLYNVKDYEHIFDKKIYDLSIATSSGNLVKFPDAIIHKFRINSTTKGGSPVEKIWNIYLSDRTLPERGSDDKMGKDSWKVIYVEDASD